MTVKPVVFTRETDTPHQRCGNRVRLEDSTGTLIDSTTPLPVSPGAVTVTVVEVQLTPTISNAVAYAAGDALGGLLEFVNAAGVAGGSGTVTKVAISDEDGQEAPVDLVLVDQTFTATADNNPFGLTDADLENCLGFIDVANTDYSIFANNSMAAKTSGLRMPFEFVLAAGGTSLFGQLVVRDTPTYGSTGSISVRLTIEQND